MKTVLFFSMGAWAALFCAMLAICIGIGKVVACYKERNALRAEVKAMHRRSNRVSAEWLEAKGGLEQQLADLEEKCSRIRQEAVADCWVNRAVLDDYERIIDQQAQDMARQKHIIETLNKQLERRKSK